MVPQHVIVTRVSVFTIKRPKGASAMRAHGVLMVKKLNKCILSFLVRNLVIDRYRNVSIHRYIDCIHEIITVL